MEIKTDRVKPYHITEGRVREFGAATQDLNKFHENYAYGSQVTGWVRHATTELLASNGMPLKCAKQESRFGMPVPIGSHIRLPRLVQVEYDSAEKQARVELNLYFKDDAEEKKPVATATFVYRPTLQMGRADLAGKPQSDYELGQRPAELVASALAREGIDLETLTFGYASPTLQQHSDRIINPGELPIFLSQSTEFYDLEKPLAIGDKVYIAITNARRKKGLGGPQEVRDSSIIQLVTTRGDAQSGEIVTKVRFIIGIIGQGQSIDQVIAGAGTQKVLPGT